MSAPPMRDMPKEHIQARFDLYIDHLRNGSLPMKAARKAGLPYKAIEYKRKTDDDFASDEQFALDEFAEEMEQVIMDAARATQVYDSSANGGKGGYRDNGPSRDAVAAAEKWLKARNRRIWNPKDDTTVTHNVNVSLTDGNAVRELQARLEERQRKLHEAFTPGFLQAFPQTHVLDTAARELHKEDNDDDQ